MAISKNYYGPAYIDWAEAGLVSPFSPDQNIVAVKGYNPDLEEVLVEVLRGEYKGHDGNGFIVITKDGESVVSGQGGRGNLWWLSLDTLTPVLLEENA
ncbi:hypothetical protein [Salinivibrio phage CW02]|uniref:Uncharacterized protein n=1 Tax=Salinivibrio phage CW02 TaxID=1161935 RepID=H9D1E1_9CAUD|nr:hypothetical protein F490_gp54 [Salinivibrio phage CW02]AFE86183.1 hypothetical protein [Salinivibrio phage CW02]